MGLVAPEHPSPCRSSMVLATRETLHIRFTIGGLSLGVIFSSRWVCRSRPSTAISQTATTLSSSTRQALWLRNIAAALIVDTITTTTSQRLVVMPEACPGGQQGTASSTGLVARLGDRRGLATTAVFGISQRLLPPTMCGNPNPDASFDRGC